MWSSHKGWPQSTGFSVVHNCLQAKFTLIIPPSIKRMLLLPLLCVFTQTICAGRTCWQGSWGACQAERRVLGMARFPPVIPGPHPPIRSRQRVFLAQSGQLLSRAKPYGEAPNFRRHYRLPLERDCIELTAEMLVSFPQPGGYRKDKPRPG